MAAYKFVVNLIKNHLYPTYQLHALMASRKLTLEEGWRYGILTVLSWLRARMGRNCPQCLQLPEPEDYAKVAGEDLSSLHIHAGYNISIISLPEKGVWSLQLTEPDLGSNPGLVHQDRQPVPGRVIETHVGFVIVDGELEFGVQTLIADPENAELAASYRPAFVKKLYNSSCFGLKQIIDLAPEVYNLNTEEQLKKMVKLWENPQHQLPCVVITPERLLKEKHVSESRLSLEQLQQPLPEDRKFFNAHGGNVIPIDLPEGWEMMPFSRPAQKETSLLDKLKQCEYEEEYVQPGYGLQRFAQSLCGYGRVYYLEQDLLAKFRQLTGCKIANGEAVVLHPLPFGGGFEVFTPEELGGTAQVLTKYVMNYSREKVYNFGNIVFLTEAAEVLSRQTQELAEEHEEQSQKWQLQKNILQADFQAKLNEKADAAALLQNKIMKLEQELNIAKVRNQNLTKAANEQSEDYVRQLKVKDEYIAYLQRKLARPAGQKDIAAWAEENFKDTLILHPRAVQLLESADMTKERVQEVFDALEFLATDYWQWRYEGFSADELSSRMSRKYDRRYTVTQLTEMTINCNPNQYLVPYINSGAKKAHNRALDYHLKLGVKAEHLIRIYFFHDDERKLIVVGSLPDHLNSTKD